MILTGPEIAEARRNGEVFIDPFDPDSVGSAQYDVTLGENFWVPLVPACIQSRRQTVPSGHLVHPSCALGEVFNPYDWRSPGAFEFRRAEPKTVVEKKWSTKLVGIRNDELVFMLGPGQTVLGHTREFIGSNSQRITCEMKSRSSTGRSFLEFCRCAGMGDHGYCNRWTVEVQNNSQHFYIPLVVGRRYAQILFHWTATVAPTLMYRGKYQAGGGSGNVYGRSAYASKTEAELMAMESAWTPEDMLPKMYLDREVPEL